MIKISVFNKINDSLIEEAVKYFSQMSRSSGQSRSICFTVNSTSHFEQWVSEWVSSFLTAHQHVIGYFSALQWCEYSDKIVEI